MTGGAPITTTVHVEGPRKEPGATYLSWSREGRATLPRYLAGLAVILLGWLAGTLAVQVPLIAVWRGSPVAPITPAGQLAAVLATFTLALVAVP